MEIRPARFEDIPDLWKWMKESGGEEHDLTQAIVYVAIEDGRKIGFLATRMVWQIEPLLVRQDVPTVKASRAALLLYRAFEAWLKGPQNTTGVRWFFAVTRSEAVKGWARRLGWLRMYRGAETYVKHLKEGE